MYPNPVQIPGGMSPSSKKKWRAERASLCNLCLDGKNIYIIHILHGLHATQTMFCHLQVILAVIWNTCDSDMSALLAWDASTSSLLWERSFENTLQSLCKDDRHIFAGSVLDNENSISHCVVDVCCSNVFFLRFIVASWQRRWLDWGSNMFLRHRDTNQKEKIEKMQTKSNKQNTM